MRILVDAGIWLAIFDPTDAVRDRATVAEHALDSSLRQRRPLSLTDCLLRVVLDELGTGLSYLATYNVRDFADVCLRNKIEILS
ncbi:MAG: hypothetical protein ACKO6F_06405 [Cyanobium sp.]